MLITVCDIETNGFKKSGANPCSPVSFAWQTWDKTLTLLKDSGVIYFDHPSIFFSQEAYNVHGLSKEFLSQYKDKFYDNLAKMYKILYRGRIVGHNIDGFDLPMIDQFVQRFGYNEIMPTQTYDTMLLYAPHNIVNGRAKWPKLAEALKLSGISKETVSLLNNVYFPDCKEAGDYHSATYDVTATTLLMKYLLKQGWVSIL